MRSLQGCLWLGMSYEYARFASWCDRLLIRNFILVRWSEIWVTGIEQKAAAQAKPFLLFPYFNMQFCKTSFSQIPVHWIWKYWSYQFFLVCWFVFLFLPASAGVVNSVQNLWVVLSQLNLRTLSTALSIAYSIPFFFCHGPHLSTPSDHTSYEIYHITCFSK